MKAHFGCRSWPIRRFGVALTPGLLIAALIGMSNAAPALAQARSETPPAGRPAPADDQPMDTVTVEAERAKALVRKQVSAFVSAITVAPFQDTLKRWRSALCPMVAGLPRSQGEFFLEKISQFAHEAGAPLAPERCEANLAIVFTSRPEELLRAWSRRNVKLFLGAGARRITRFIDESRPVRIWYNSTLMAVDGMALGEFQDIAGGVPNNPHARASHIAVDEVRTLDAVLIVVDTGRVSGVTYDQLAGYIAMASLAELHADAPLGDAVTILGLFATPQRAPADGLSPWDKAYLRALYHTQQGETMQLQDMKSFMVRDLGAAPGPKPAASSVSQPP